MSNQGIVHVFICTNQRKKGKCCAAFSAESVFNCLRSEINTKRKQITGNRIKAVKTSCLGQCAAGPNIYIASDDIWYTYSSLEDVSEIVDVHFIKGERLERLINKGVINV